MKVQFLGAAKTVTGSCYMIEACGKRFCVDCGMHQGNKAIEQRNRDIKPYLPYADCRPEASGGFTDQTPRHHLQVGFPREWLERVPENKRAALCAVLENDPRPSYQHDAGRVYGFVFAGCEVRFTVDGEVLTVRSVGPENGA